ncbi:MAG: hypothetical protein SFX19_03925 [Alphaproteobacteria bacterium]|nr:hypothetical protein [Alphaproteobacteria bacterium]
MLTQQKHIIACARSYIGTRFSHQGRLKKTGSHKGGIDCLGLLVCVAAELDLRGKNGKPFAAFDERGYSHQPDTDALRQRFEMLLIPIPITGIKPADIALFTIDGAPQHMGILASPPTSNHQRPTNLIHAYAPARAVVEHTLDGYWQEKMTAAFRLPHIHP